MNGSLADAVKLAQGVAAGIDAERQLLGKNDFLVCPPFQHLVPVQAELGEHVSLGAQDCSPFENGAYTGDVSGEMLKDINASHVILGHSERRQYYAESNLLVKKKAMMAQDAGLTAIICVGETEEEREAGKVEEVVGRQLRGSIPDDAESTNTVIAYEPVWAIGTGKSATPDDIAAVHNFIREQLEEMIDDPDGGGANVRILYGGSVKPANAAKIFAVENVNGALIGGASLKAEDFIGIAQAK